MTTTTRSVVTRIYPTPPSSPSNNDGSGNDSPSWGLIIAILMIVVFLAGVSICLYWHKWRKKRSQRNQTGATPRTSFKRSYRGSRTNRGMDSVRNSTKSTIPLRNSLNEKINTKRNSLKVASVNVVPIQSPEVGKYAVYWDQNHWKVCPCPPNMTASRHSASGSRPLSPITEVDSPNKTAELSKTYEVSEQGSEITPYQITWITPNPPPPYEQSESKIAKGHALPTIQIETSNTQHDVDHLSGYEPCQNSPFFPNNNTPTTEHDIDSFFEESRIKFIDDATSSQTTSCPHSPDLSQSDSRIADGRSTSLASSYPETSYEPSSRQSDRQSGYHNSGMTSMSDHSGGSMSLSGNMSRFEKQASCMEDKNNNSAAVPDSNLSYPAAKGLNYTLASSVTSSDNTQYSDHTSMLPNIGSSSYTTGMQSTNGLQLLSVTNEHSDFVSPEDLSKLVDEMSSIRPNSSTDPTVRVVDTSDQSFTAGFQQSCANTPTEAPKSASSTGTNEISFAWDHYPLNEMPATVRPHSEQPLHVKELENIYRQTLERSHRMSFQAPVLSEKQYWV